LQLPPDSVTAARELLERAPTEVLTVNVASRAHRRAGTSPIVADIGSGGIRKWRGGAHHAVSLEIAGGDEAGFVVLHFFFTYYW